MISIMQPSFLPWLGFFYLIKKVDTFVFLNDVQIEKTGWQRRNFITDEKLKKERLLTIPINRKITFPMINQAEIVFGRDYDKIVNSIRNNYSKQKNYTLVEKYVLEPLISARDTRFNNINLDELNSNIIMNVSEWLEIDTNFLFSSDLEITSIDKVQKLIEINKLTNSRAYLATPGSLGYLQEQISAFSAARISVKTLKINNTANLKKQWMKHFYSLTDVLIRYDKKQILNMLEDDVIFNLVKVS